MDWKSRNTVYFLAVFSLVLSHTPFAMAWDSDIHQNLVRLSDLGRLDKKLQGLRSVIIDGADRPDRNKSLDHYSRARFHATRAFNAACKKYLSGLKLESAGKTGQARGKYEEAAQCLGNSFHYMEDLQAVEKKVDEPGILPLIGPKGHKEVVRKLAKEVIQETLSNEYNRRDFRKSADSYRASTFARFNNVDQMLGHCQKMLKAYAEQATGIFDGKTSGNQKRLELKKVVRFNLLLTVASIDRAIELFNDASPDWPGLDGRWSKPGGVVVEFRGMEGYYVEVGYLKSYHFRPGELGYRLSMKEWGYDMKVKYRYTDPNRQPEWRDFTLKVLDNDTMVDNAGVKWSRIK